MSKYVFDTEISLKAIGLMTLILSLPKGSDLTVNALMRHTKDGYESTRNAFRELEAHGYIKRVEKRSFLGNYAGEDFVIDADGGITDGQQK